METATVPGRRNAARDHARRNWVEPAALVLLLIAAVVMRVWPLHGAGTDYDEGVYWQSLMAMDRGHSLFSQIYSSQPPLFLLSIHPLYVLFGRGIAAARLAVALLSILGIVALWWSVRSLAGKVAGYLAALLLVADSAYLWASHSLQAEVPSVAMGAVAVALAIGSGRVGASLRVRSALALLAGAAVAVSTMIKLSGAASAAPVAIYLLVPWFARGGLPIGSNPSGRVSTRAVRMSLYATAGFLLVAGLVLLTESSHLTQMWDQMIRMHMLARSALPAGVLPTLGLLLEQPAQIPLAVLSLISVGVAISRRATAVVAPAAWFLATLAALTMVRPVFAHMQVLLVPPLVMVGSLALPLVTRWRRADPMPQTGRTVQERWLTGAVIATVTCATVTGFWVGVVQTREAAYPLSPSDLAMVAAMRSQTSPTSPVVTDNQYLAAVAGRSVPPELVDTSFVRLATGNLSAPYLESIVRSEHVGGILFATGRFDLVSGFRPWVSAHFDEGVSFPDGSQLFVPFK
jgi:hypothetical protein